MHRVNAVSRSLIQTITQSSEKLQQNLLPYTQGKVWCTLYINDTRAVQRLGKTLQ